ncbi:MAG: hypothetical protein HUJ54_04560 [Erysipelotrichaceae bacterium]|nr:hypothetical protein [Erysipelotrichaceae bacterium]
MKNTLKNTGKYIVAAGCMALVMSTVTMTSLAASNDQPVSRKSAAEEQLSQKIEDFTTEVTNGMKNSAELKKIFKKAAEKAEKNKQNETESAPVKQAEAAADQGFDHTVHGVGSAEFQYGYTQDFLNSIRSGSSRLYYTAGCKAEADYALGEIVYDYCGLASGGAYYEGRDGDACYLDLIPDQFETLYAAVQSADQQWAQYSSQVASALYSLNLHCTDHEMVEQINDYICDNYSYVLTNQANMPNFMASHVGQCWHYAKLFADMCNSVGIPASKIQNEEHAWDIVTVDGVTYTFDVTWNDTSGNRTAYSWQ